MANRAQVGINDTPLTSALAVGDFKTAEKIIKENIDPSLLDEGPFHKIPLALVLTGNAEGLRYPCHLRLAKLLVEGGANPNLRIPQLERIRATPSPMELLANIYMSVYTGSRGFIPHNWLDLDVNNSYIGLHDEEKLSPKELLDQFLELFDVFFAYGGDPNVTTTMANSSLYHIVLSSARPDINIIMKFCEAGGSMNTRNAHGTTPLMDIVTYASGDLSMDILPKILARNSDISSLNARNCVNETALWHSMNGGSPRMALELLQRGADISPHAMVCLGKRTTYLRTNSQSSLKHGVSPLFAPFLQNSYVCVHLSTVQSDPDLYNILDIMPNQFSQVDIYLLNKVMTSTINPVVDNFSQCFPTPILFEIERILTQDTNFQMSELISPTLGPHEVAVLMFGNLQAGLQQLCVRQIVQRVFFEGKIRKELRKGPAKMLEETGDTEFNECDGYSTFVKDVDRMIRENNERNVHWNILQGITAQDIHDLVTEQLKLPWQLEGRFKIEAARLQIGATMYTLESVNCFQACEGDSDVSSVIDDEEVDEDDDDYDSDEVKNVSRYAFRYKTSADEWVLAGSSEGEDDMEITSSNSSDDLSPEVKDSPVSDDNNELERNSTISESCNSNSGESIPHNIPRDEYETFSNDLYGDEDVSPTSAMDKGNPHPSSNCSSSSKIG